MSNDNPTSTDTHRVRRVYALAPVFFPHDAPWNDYAAQQFDNWLTDLLAGTWDDAIAWSESRRDGDAYHNPHRSAGAVQGVA